MTRLEMETWVAALRSGEYKQGRKSLKKLDGTYCCLGVKCDLDDKTKWIFDEDFHEYRWKGRSCYLPLDEERDLQSNNISMCVLAIMNDDGKSFAEIADYIEANYKETT